jgi:alkaline phosphatase
MNVALRSLCTCALTLTLAVAGHAAPKNIIFMLADGMGYNHIDAASMYRYGDVHQQVYWTFTHMPVSTYSANNKEGYNSEKAWEDFKYFLRVPTDSAASATTLSTGVKTMNGRIGQDPDGEPLRHIIEDAETMGKATGVLSTVMFAHASPASFVTHHVTRKDYEAIAKKMISDSAVDLIIGAGHPHYDNDAKRIGSDEEPDYRYVGGEEVWTALQAGKTFADADGDGHGDAWTLVDSTDDLIALADGETPERVLGVLPVRATLQVDRGGEDKNGPYETPLNSGVPTMADLMLSALNVLDDDPDGFFLMAEGGAVDWASHGNQPGRLIEEQVDFDKAIEAAIDWVNKNSSWEETALFITGDHECGYLTGPESGEDWKPLVNNGKGKLPGMEFHSTGHTNQLLPVFAKGAGTEALTDKVRGADMRHGAFIDNTDINAVMRSLWGL